MSCKYFNKNNRYVLTVTIYHWYHHNEKKNILIVNEGYNNLKTVIFLFCTCTGVLTCISEELENAPFYYQLPDLASRVHSKVPTTIEFTSALINAGE